MKTHKINNNAISPRSLLGQMQPVIVALLLVLASSVLGFAGVTCQPTTYDQYVGSACGILDQNYSNFSYSTFGVGESGMPAASINVTPLNTQADPGFLFNAHWGANSNQEMQSVIGFTVNSSSAPITNLTLQMLGAGFTATGMASVTEKYCLGDTFADSCHAGTQGTLSTLYDQYTQKASDSVSFAGVSEVDVVETIDVAAQYGSAEISGVQNNFGEAPEPGSLVLFGTGILGLAGALRRKLF